MIHAGIHRTDISPPTGIRLQGHDAREKFAAAVHDPLMLKVLTLYDGRTRLAIVTSDLIYFDQTFHDSVRAAILARTGIAPQRVLLSASHTHTGPFMTPGSEHYMPDYIALLQRQVVAGIAEAINREQPATLRLGEGQIDIGIMHRRRRTAQGVIMQPNPRGPVDPFCGVLRVDDQAGRPLAILFQYACHPTTLATDIAEISADYPGQAQQTLERCYPGATAMFLNGCCGDVRPAIIQDNTFTGGSHEDAARMGRLLASEVIRCSERARALRGQRLAARLEAHDLPLDQRWLPHRPDRLRRRCEQWVKRDPGAAPAAQRWLEHWLAQPADAQRPTSVPGRLQVLRIGELAILALTGEVMTEYGLAIRAARRGPLLIASYAQPAMGYVPTRAALRQGGYEARSFLSRLWPAPYAPDVESDLVRAAGRLLR